MAGSTYSTNLKIELMTTGENSGTWGDVTNTNLGTALEQAVVGYGNPDYVSDANLTISITNSNAAQAARALVLNVTSVFGSLTQTRELVVPTIQKQYIVQNNTTGGQSITVKTSAGTGITVPNGRKAHLYVDGTNVIQMFDYVDINGGSIDGTPIGASSASTGAFTTLNASGATTLDGNVTLGNASGDTVTVTGTISSNLLFTDNTYDIGASGATRPRNLYLAGAATIGGNLSVGGTLTLTGGLTLNGNVTVGDSASDTLTINSTVTSNLIFTDNTYDIGASGATRPRNLFIAGNITAGGNQTLTGALTVDSTTDTSSATTGSIQTDGGIGIAKGLYVGGNTTLGDAAADTVTVNGTITSNLIFTDNTYDIGASGATRPRNLYLSNTATIGGGLTVAGNTFLGDSSSDTLNLNGTTINLNTTAEIYGNGSQTASLQTTLGITARTSGTAGAGFGTSLGFNAEASDGSNYSLTTIDSYWSDATPATRTSVMDFSTRVNAGNLTPRLSIAGNGTFTFKNVGTDAGVTKMTLNSVGLSIGTTVTTNYPLEVYNTSAGTGTIGAALINNSSTAATGVGLAFQPSSASTRTAQILTYNDGSNGISMKFALSNQNTPVDKVWFKMDGKVGIGLDPTYFFDVAKGEVGTIARFGGDDTGANSRGLTIASSTTTYIGDTFTLNAPSNGGTIILQTFNTNAMYINNSQEIGFGQNPASGYRINVNGYARFSNSSSDEYLNIVSTYSGGRNWNIGSVANSSSISPPGTFAFRDSSAGETRMWVRGDPYGVNIGPYAATAVPWNGFTAYDIRNGMSSLTNYNNADTFLNHQCYYDGNWRFSTTGQSAATLDVYSNTSGGGYEFRVSTTSNASATAGNITTWYYPLLVNQYGISLGNSGNAAPVSGTGIRFPTTQNNSSNVNTLDDYEEGTWTPTPAGSTTAGTYSTGGITGTYTKVGRLVTVTCTIYATGFTGTGDFTVTGLPFPITDNVATGAVQFNSNPFSNLLTVPSQITAMFFDGSSQVSFRQSDNSVSGGGYNQLQCRGSSGYSIEYLRFSCTYQTST